MVRHGRQLPQRRVAGRRTLHADQRRHVAVRSDDDGSEGVHAAMDHTNDAAAAERHWGPRLRVHSDARRAWLPPHVAERFRRGKVMRGAISTLAWLAIFAATAVPIAGQLGRPGGL